MENSAEHIVFLWEQYLNKKASPEQVAELFALLKSESDNALLNDALLQAMGEHSFTEKLGAEQREALLNRIMSTISGEGPHEKESRPIYRIPFFRRAWVRYAAIFMLIAGVAIYFLAPVSNRSTSVVKNIFPTTPDIGPGTDKAMLTLADGTIIELDSNSTGAIASQGNSDVIMSPDGQLVYSLNRKSSGKTLWNTMSTPRGGQYSLILPDGTKVWLNAASSITYPAEFVGKERRIRLTGEAYMEVAADKEKPFLVDADGKSTVEVLGTSFNINAYADEPAVRTTLVEGRVRVTRTDTRASAVVHPWQVASVLHTKDGKGTVEVSEANIREAVAWKNGLFHFQNTELPAVVRQLEKWYDVQFRFDGNIPDIRLIGEIKRGVKLSTILVWFEDLGIKTRQEGRTVIIL